MKPTWNKILVHHSASKDGAALDFDAIRRHHIQVNGWSDVGYHFLVEQIGEGARVLMGRPLYREGSHCPGQNQEAVGVCFIGDFTETPPSPSMLAEGARLIAGLSHALKIPPGEVYPHRRFRATECPGNSFPLEELRRRVSDLLR